MKLRELLKQIADQNFDMDDEVFISASSNAYEDEIPIERTKAGRPGSRPSLLLIPETQLTSNDDINS